jgi:hypothetical protein
MQKTPVKIQIWLLFSVPRLLLGWIARVCCQLPLFAWCDRESVIDENIEYFDTHRDSIVPDFGVWVEGMQDSEKGTFLALQSHLPI